MKTEIKIGDFLNWIQQELNIKNMLKSSVFPFPGEKEWIAQIADCKVMNEKTTSSVVGWGDNPAAALMSFVENTKGKRIKIGEREFEFPENLTV